MIERSAQVQNTTPGIDRYDSCDIDRYEGSAHNTLYSSPKYYAWLLLSQTHTANIPSSSDIDRYDALPARHPPAKKKKCYARKNARPGYVLIHIYQIWANIADLLVPILTDMNTLLFFFLAARIPSHHGRRWAKILGAQFSCFSGTKVRILTQKAFYYITRHMSGCSTGRGLFSRGGLKL